MSYGLRRCDFPVCIRKMHFVSSERGNQRATFVRCFQSCVYDFQRGSYKITGSFPFTFFVAWQAGEPYEMPFLVLQSFARLQILCRKRKVWKFYPKDRTVKTQYRCFRNISFVPVDTEFASIRGCLLNSRAS